MSLQVLDGGNGRYSCVVVGVLVRAANVQQLIQWIAEAGGVEYAGEVDQPRETAGGVGASGEAEEVDFIARLVVVAEKAVAVDDVVIQPGAAEAAAHLVSFGGADAAAVVENLAGAVVRDRWDGAQQFNDVGYLAAFVVGVPGAVQAEDEPTFGHDLLLVMGV